MIKLVAKSEVDFFTFFQIIYVLYFPSEHFAGSLAHIGLQIIQNGLKVLGFLFIQHFYVQNFKVFDDSFFNTAICLFYDAQYRVSKLHLIRFEFELVLLAVSCQPSVCAAKITVYFC